MKCFQKLLKIKKSLFAIEIQNIYRRCELCTRKTLPFWKVVYGIVKMNIQSITLGTAILKVLKDHRLL